MSLSLHLRIIYKGKLAACWYQKIDFEEIVDPFSDDVITTETMMKAKMLSLKYEKDIPVDFWTEVLKEENDSGEFLVENLFKKMKRG